MFARAGLYIIFFAVLALTDIQARAQCSATTGGRIKVAIGPVGGTLTVMQCANAGDDIFVPVAGFTGDRLIHIYDANAPTTPLVSMGRLTLTGQLSSQASIAVLVANQNQTWVSSNSQNLSSGFINCGGVVVEDSDARSRSRVSIAVTGTVEHRGASSALDVHVNQVVRIQTDDAINANIIATGAGAFVGATSTAIGQIRAGHAIRGDITAENGDIFAVRVLNVSPLPDAEGISGSIRAKGNIGTIFSTGPISGPSITSGGKIEQIRTVSEAVPSTVLPLNVSSAVSTGVGLDGSTVDPGLLTGIAAEDSPLGLVDIGGSLLSSMNIANLAVPAGFAGPRAGIFVRDAVQATINIRHNLDHSKIVAYDLEQASIIIGNRMTGAIVEYRRDATPPDLSGDLLTFISVGLGPVPEAYEGQTAGMTGTNCPPVDMHDPARPEWWFQTPDCDGSTFDGLIRVVRAKGIVIRRMTLETEPGVRKQYMPRVEVLEVRDLSVDFAEEPAGMEAGVLWSGVLDSPSANVESNDYIQLTTNGAFTAACLSPVADAWITGGSSFPITVRSDMLGEIHVPSLPSGQTVRIGHQLGDRLTQTCGCAAASTFPSGHAVQPCPGQSGQTCLCACTLNAGEESPRAFHGGVQLAPIGRVIVADQSALAGQVVINASNMHERLPDGSNALDFCRGRVDVSPSTQLSPIIPPIPSCAAQSEIAPAHTTPVSTYGGGDAGHVPYRVHYESSTPPDARYCRDTNFAFGYVSAQALASAGVSPVRVRYDGPLQMYDPFGAKPGRILSPDSNWNFVVDSTALFDFDMDPNDPNALRIFGHSSNPDDYVLSGGRMTQLYVFVPKTAFTDDNVLLCLGSSLLDASNVPVSTDSFMFGVIYDCNENQVADPDEIASMAMALDCDSSGILDSCEIMDDPGRDQNGNGILDECEAPSSCTVNGFPVRGDFNCSGGNPTVQDIFDFLGAWFGNCTAIGPAPCQFGSADVNHSGGNPPVTIQDLFDFLGAFFGNCPAQTPCP